jgi:hypothetical protein
MNFEDYYSILRILPQATQKEIESAYKILAKKWHPDANKGVDTTVKMQQISEAYGILKNAERRRKYDIEYFRYIQTRIQNQQKTQVKIEICYYCGKNIANNKFSNKETLYKETSRTRFPQRKVTYKTVDVEIPRCEQCYKIHRSDSGLFVWLPIVAFTILGLIIGLTIYSNWLPFLFVGIFVGSILGMLLSWIDKSIIAKEAGIKKESDFSDFGLVSILYREGWTTNQPKA